MSNFNVGAQLNHYAWCMCIGLPMIGVGSQVINSTDNTATIARTPQPLANQFSLKWLRMITQPIWLGTPAICYSRGATMKSVYHSELGLSHWSSDGMVMTSGPIGSATKIAKFPYVESLPAQGVFGTIGAIQLEIINRVKWMTFEHFSCRSTRQLNWMQIKYPCDESLPSQLLFKTIILGGLCPEHHMIINSESRWPSLCESML